MPELIKLRWRSSVPAGLPRKDRQGCDYEAYVPDPLVGRAITLDGASAADVADAERAVGRLEANARDLADSEAIARLLLRAEAVASSKIEGLEVGGRRLLKAQLARALDQPANDVTAQEILNNIEAMSAALADQQRGCPITLERLLETHARLLGATSLEAQAGRLREQQNWIGGSSYNPCSAEFVPPPHERVTELMADLCEFASQDGLPALVQAALAHAQFETVHPFIDGNGRVGRALIQLILRRRGLTVNVTPPISLVLATWSRDYIRGLTATRHNQPNGSPSAQKGSDDWIALFAAATSRAVADAEIYEQTVAEIKSHWRERLGRVRRDSAAALLLDALPGAPIVTVASAAALTGRSEQAVNTAIPRLLDAQVLTQTTIGRRNRAFEAPEMIDAFTALERRLASPAGDTRHSLPARRVPRPRPKRGPKRSPTG
ncbi:MAG TPA: Fic family protein [Solirubrobacteraceae bacterium]|jgi:Fic family protein|nr:Fic family protein [Solirubrobacteraceae bacterium]